mgnify:CR=1 FL=1
MERLFTKTQLEQMLKNGRQTQEDHIGNHPPVVRLFMPDGPATWLLSEIDPEEPDIAFGLCDLGLGFPEMGYVSLSEITSIRGSLGLPIERDLHFSATQDLMSYAKEARSAGRILV